ncbi:MAG: ATP-binding protein [Patescibacteria group bacterium]|jgi:signal transduction histidine kinase
MESVKTKILSSFLIVIGILFIFNVVFFVAHSLIIKKYQDIAGNMISEYKLAQLSSDLIKAYASLTKPDEHEIILNEYQAIRREITDTLAKLDSAIISENSLAVYAEVKNDINEVISESDEGLALFLKGEVSLAETRIASAQQKNDSVREDSIKLVIEELKYTEKLQVQTDRIQLLTTLIGGLILLLISAGCIIYALAFSKKLISPLTSLTKVAKLIEAGDLNVSVDQNLLHVFQNRGDLLQGNDEISSLANSFNTMLFHLRNNIQKLQEYNEQLIKTRQQVTSGELKISQLKELDRMKNEIMNIATHELKTPLVSIVGLSDVMLQPNSSLSPDFKKYVSIIHDEGTKLTELIRRMLKTIKNESGQNSRLEVVKKKFNLSELVSSLGTPLNIMAKRTNSQVAVTVAVPGINIESDQEKISQVIYNFVDNAIKYGPNSQTIRVTLDKADDKFVKIEVSNDGPGIPEEKQKKLFLKFSQLEPSLSRSQDGIGLGLYICKQSVESLGGKIGVNSQPGKGVTFYFTLPLES